MALSHGKTGGHRIGDAWATYNPNDATYTLHSVVAGEPDQHGNVPAREISEGGFADAQGRHKKAVAPANTVLVTPAAPVPNLPGQYGCRHHHGTSYPGPGARTGPGARAHSGRATGAACGSRGKVGDRDRRRRHSGDPSGGERTASAGIRCPSGRSYQGGREDREQVRCPSLQHPTTMSVSRGPARSRQTRSDLTSRRPVNMRLVLTRRVAQSRSTSRHQPETTWPSRQWPPVAR